MGGGGMTNDIGTLGQSGIGMRNQMAPYGGNWFSGGTPLKTGGPVGTTNTNEYGAAYGWNPGAPKTGGTPLKTGGPIGTTNTNAFGNAYGWNPGQPGQQPGQKPTQWMGGGDLWGGGGQGWDISQAFQHLFGGMG